MVGGSRDLKRTVSGLPVPSYRSTRVGLNYFMCPTNRINRHTSVYIYWSGKHIGRFSSFFL